MALRGGADIVVATPGRLLNLVEQNALRLTSLDLLVLDEADRLLSLGFSDELSRILDLLGPHQTLLFSATFPPTVRALAEAVLFEPLRVDAPRNAAFGAADAAIMQRAIEVDADKRTMLLRHLLATEAWPRVLVFVASRYAADHVAEKLHRAKIAAAPFHGDLAQGTRTDTLDAFREQELRVLVATDVAGRGIDIAGLPAVVNYNLPRSAADYVHRIGRTGRAGETGVAISFVTADAEAHFKLIEKRNRVSVERERIEGFEPRPAGSGRPQARSRSPRGREGQAQEQERQAPRSGSPKGVAEREVERLDSVSLDDLELVVAQDVGRDRGVRLGALDAADAVDIDEVGPVGEVLRFEDAVGSGRLVVVGLTNPLTGRVEQLDVATEVRRIGGHLDRRVCNRSLAGSRLDAVPRDAETRDGPFPSGAPAAGTSSGSPTSVLRSASRRQVSGGPPQLAFLWQQVLEMLRARSGHKSCS